MSKPEVVSKKFGTINVEVTASDNEVRVWGCSPKTGMCIFRIKAVGKAHFNRELTEIVVVPK
jgi:hypothetical protein